MPKFEVLFYQTTTGKQPAKEFLLSLDIKSQFKHLQSSLFLLLRKSNNPHKRICQENIKNACKRN